MTRSQPPISANAVAWALLSQTIWLPLVAIDAHDRWQSRVRSLEPPTETAVALHAAPKGSGDTGGRTNPSAGSAQAGDSNTGLVLGSASLSPDPLLDGPVDRSIEQAAPLSKAASLGLAGGYRPWSAATIAAMGSASPPAASFHSPRAAALADPLQRSFTRSELLGGTLTLNDLHAPTMPVMARAERARWAGSGDPMAPLPQPWREPLRQALRTLPNASAKVVPARVVHVPSTRVTRSTSVPLALQSDGTVDILSRPDDPAVVKEIETWSSRQNAPQAGTVAPAVVNIEPLPPEPSPSPTASEPAAATVQAAATVSEIPAATESAPATSAPAPAEPAATTGQPPAP